MGLLGYGTATENRLQDPLAGMELQGLLGRFAPQFSPMQQPIQPMQQQQRQGGGSSGSTGQGGGLFDFLKSGSESLFNNGFQWPGSTFNGAGVPGAANGTGSANPFTLNADMAGSPEAFGGGATGGGEAGGGFGGGGLLGGGQAGGDAAAGGLGGGSGGGLGSLGGGFAAPLGFAALIGAGKTVENNNANNPLGRGLLSGLGPSISQMVADPKLGLTTAFGVPFLNGFIRSDKAANTKPEWASLFG